jgi:transcriptional regulator with AAA-type ATPase domain
MARLKKKDDEVVFVTTFFRRHGVGFFDMLLRAFVKDPKLVRDLRSAPRDGDVGKNADQYALLDAPVQLPSSISRAVFLIPETLKKHWASTEVRPLEIERKWNQLAESISTEYDGPGSKRVVDWLSAVRDAVSQREVFSIETALESKPEGVDGSALWQVIHELPLVDQVRWWREHSPWRAIKGVAIESIGPKSLAPEDPKGWTQALERWIEGQPENARFLVNLWGTSTENQLAWYYLAWRLPRLRGTVFCECKTLAPHEDPRRFRPIRFRRLSDDLLHELGKPVPKHHLSSPVRDRAIKQLELYRKTGDKFVILVLGERGTGKSTTVRRIFEGDPPSLATPFVEANCASFANPEMARSELFGHTAGAYTGAAKARPGLFQEANGGTLFLDECHALDPSIQRLLLLALQTDNDGNYSFKPLGADKPERTKFQLILGSNKRIDELRALFPEDFWDRIHQRRVEMPALDRAHELEGAWHKVWDNMKLRGVVDPAEIPTTGGQFLDWLKAQEFPGNFRDLQRIAILAADLQRAESLDLLDGSGRDGEGGWFAQLRRQCEEDSRSAPAPRETTSPASGAGAGASNPVELDFTMDSALTPEKLVDRFRQRIANALVETYPSKAAAERAMKVRGSRIRAQTIGRWQRLP